MPFDRSKYPDDWEAISTRLRFLRARLQCEWRDCRGRRCQARQWHRNPMTGSKVVLTTAHLDHDPQNSRESNLMVMCQFHHLYYDAPEKRRRMRYGRDYAGPHQLTLNL